MLIPSNSRWRSTPLLFMCLLFLSSLTLQAQNQIEFSIQNQRLSDNCEEYTAELWVNVLEGHSWEITSSEVGISYNTDALSAQDLSPAFEANQTLIDADVDISQSPGTGYVRLSLLKSSGSASIEGEFKLLTIKFDVEDAGLLDNLSFVTTDPTTKIFDNSVQLDFDCGADNCFGVTDPTARTAAAITVLSAPADLTVCSGDEVNWSVSVNACDPTYDWQILEDGTWESLDISTSSFTIEEADVDDGGTYRVVINAEDAEEVITNEFDLTVNVAPTVDVQPVDAEDCAGAELSFSFEMSGTPLPTIAWQVDRGDGFVALGENGTELNFPAVTADLNGNVYRAQLSNSCGEIFTDEVTLTVNYMPMITQEPVDLTICSGDDASFEMLVDAQPLADVQWEIYDADEDSWSEIEEANETTLLIEAVDTEMDGNMYRARLENECGEPVYSQEVTLTVHVAPAITQGLDEEVQVCDGDELSLTATASGTPQPEVRWEHMGPEDEEWTVIDGATETTYTVTPTVDDNGRMYRAVFTNDCGEVNSATTLDFLSLPVINTQPNNGEELVVCENTEVEVSVDAAGSNLEYVWSRDGEELEDQNGPTLQFEAIALGDAGSYDVLISNDCDEVLSETFTIVVNAQPAFTLQPENIVPICDGESGRISVEVTGVDVAVQWQKLDDETEEWVDLPDENGTTLELEEVDAADAGDYRAVLSGLCEETPISETASVVIQSAPQITGISESLTACENDEVSLEVSSNGDELVYQWYFNGDELEGENRASLDFEGVRVDQAGRYHVVVSGACEPNVQSETIELNVLQLAAVTTQPEEEQTVCENSPSEIAIEAVGSDLVIQWQKYDEENDSWVDIDGANTAVLAFEATSLDDAGEYRASLTAACESSAISESAELFVTELPRIVSQTESQTVCEADGIILEVEASGDGITYQWSFNGDELEGETASELIINPINLDDAGRYTVTVSGICEPTVESAPIDLAVNELPNITENPVALDVCMGEAVSFSADATGTGPLNFQWQRSFTGDGEWVNLPGATEKNARHRRCCTG